MQKAQTYYDIIGVSRVSSQQEIKENYREKLLKYSPDKVGLDASEEDVEKAREKYFKLQEAWKVLSDPEMKKQYDAELTVLKILAAIVVTFSTRSELKQAANTLKYDTPADSEVDVSELDYDPDEGCYYHPCRCGGEFEIPDSALHLLTHCNTCSLSIHIIDTTKKK